MPPPRKLPLSIIVQVGFFRVPVPRMPSGWGPEPNAYTQPLFGPPLTFVATARAVTVPCDPQNSHEVCRLNLAYQRFDIVRAGGTQLVACGPVCGGLSTCTHVVPTAAPEARSRLPGRHRYP